MYDGELIRLRAHEPADAERFHAFLNDREVTATLMMRYPASLADERDWVAKHSTITFGNAGFVITVKADGRAIGGCDLRGATPEDRTADLGIAISDKTAWNCGYGTDAMRTLCRFGFEEMGLERIELWVFAGNARARHVYEKVGFVHEGTARSRVYKGGRRIDEHLYGMLRADYDEAVARAASSTAAVRRDSASGST